VTIKFPPCFWIRNHRSSTLESAPIDELTKMPPRPSTIKSKPEMLEWAEEETTDHCFYNLSEPSCPGLRVSKDNECRRILGAIADYDCPATEAEILEGVKRVPADFPPAFTSRTFSQGARVIWLFEQPVPAMSIEVTKKFLDIVRKNIKPSKVHLGLDEPAFRDVARYFELGTDWKPVNPVARIPANLTTAWLAEAIKKSTFKGDISIPMNVIAAEVERRWPGRWTASFEPGVSGVRFWDEKADNERGCTIHEHGVFAFSGESRFLSWSDILGKEFVRRFAENRIGQALNGTFFDGRGYWYRDGDVFRDVNSEQLVRRLSNKFGLSQERDKKTGAPSEVMQAMAQVEEMKRIDGVFPYLYDDREIVSDEQGQFLNVSRVKVCTPAPDADAWGVNFPWMADYLDGLFDPEQLRVFIAWLAHFYCSAHKRKLRKGHGLFVAGPRGAGKTFLSSKVIGGLMGGAQEATDFILGGTNFNKFLLHSPVMAVDDAIAAGDPRKHELYSQVVKKVIANFNLTYHPKFKDAVTKQWLGRVVITLNDDPNSIQMLPTIENSILDKVIFLLARDPKVDFAGAEETLLRELPHFASWLLKHEIPTDLVGEHRFGIREYHHRELLKAARNASGSAIAKEVIDLFKKEYFTALPEKTFWEGTPTELYQALLETESLRSIVNCTFKSPNSLGRHLSTLVRQGSTGIFHGKSNDRFYRIHKHEAH
jgi:hypothetical protein